MTRRAGAGLPVVAARFGAEGAVAKSTIAVATPASPTPKPIVLTSANRLPASAATLPSWLQNTPLQLFLTTAFFPSASPPITPPTASAATPAPPTMNAAVRCPLDPVSGGGGALVGAAPAEGVALAVDGAPAAAFTLSTICFFSRFWRVILVSVTSPPGACVVTTCSPGSIGSATPSAASD